MDEYQSRIADIYSQRFSRVSNIVDPGDQQLLLLEQVIPNDRNQLVLDAGCGDGRYSKYLYDCGFSSLHAMDLFPSVEIDGIQYQQGSIEKLPFEDGYFDFVLCFSCIFYVNPATAIREFARVLRPGGKILITGHTKWSLDTIWRIICRDIIRRKSTQHLDGVRFIPTSTYISLLRGNGFNVEGLCGWNSSASVFQKMNLLSKELKPASIEFAEPQNGRWTLTNRFQSETRYHFGISASRLI